MSIQEAIFTAPKKKRSTILTTGFALFSMFFGAGNLVFPILIGKAVGDNTWWAILGLSITAVLVPFLGLAGILLFEGSMNKFFGRMGKIPGFLLIMFLQLILGPFGVIPRLVTLMHAMAKPYLFDISLISFSILAGVVIFFCSFKRQYLIQLIGSILTPIKLLSLAALVGLGLWGASSISTEHPPAWNCFLEGFLGGYNTMDLIAAFLFATVILPHFQKEEESEKDEQQKKKTILKKMFFSSLIASSLLLLTYIGLAWISSYHSWTLDASYKPEELLGAIANKILGPTGGCIAAIAVIMACLTTAITLVSIFAEYLHKDLCKGKIASNTSLIITLAAAMLFANLGFGGILAFLGPVLMVVYPGLILLSILNILHSLYGFRMVKMPVILTFTVGLILAMI